MLNTISFCAAIDVSTTSQDLKPRLIWLAECYDTLLFTIKSHT